jgi:hypothetical protein
VSDAPTPQQLPRGSVAERLVPSRRELSSRVVETLSRGGWGNPDVLLVEGAGGFVVVKDFAARPAWIHPLGRWLTRRELRAYRQLRGHSCVPRLLGSVDALAFCLEYRPGEILTRKLRGRLPATFLGELSDALTEMHARGVAHLDLRHRSNVLAGRDGRPVLLDFASAACFSPGGVAARWLLPWLVRIDRRAFEKWQARLGEPS